MELHKGRWIGNERDESIYYFELCYHLISGKVLVYVLSRKRIAVVSSIMKSKNWWRDGCRLVV